MTKRRVNPLSFAALTIDDALVGQDIMVLRPNQPSTEWRYLKVLDDPFTDDDGDVVVTVRDAQTGRHTTELASTLGLCGDRHTGEYSTIALRDDTRDW